MEIDLANLLNDPAFEELKLRLERPNVFEVLGIARREVPTGGCWIPLGAMDSVRFSWNASCVT